VLAVASWDSKVARAALESRCDERVAELLVEAAEHRTVLVIGEFDEPDWLVLPDTRALPDDHGTVYGLRSRPPLTDQPREDDACE
jgi:hypothetical protein